MMRRRRTLIASPLEWQITAAAVLPPAIPVLPERGGTQLRAPRAVVDTREQTPFDFSRFFGWFARVEKKALKVGDYTIAGLEDLCAVERKDLADLIHSFTVDRPAFINRLRLMSSFPHRLSVISAALSQVKSPYVHFNINPNRILQQRLEDRRTAGKTCTYYWLLLAEGRLNRRRFGEMLGRIALLSADRMTTAGQSVSESVSSGLLG